MANFTVKAVKEIIKFNRLLENNELYFNTTDKNKFSAIETPQIVDRENEYNVWFVFANGARLRLHEFVSFNYEKDTLSSKVLWNLEQLRPKQELI